MQKLLEPLNVVRLEYLLAQRALGWLRSWRVQPVSGGQVSRRQTRRFTIWLPLTTRRQPSQPLTFTYFTFAKQGEKLHLVYKPWPTWWKESLCVYIHKGEIFVPTLWGNCAGMTRGQLITRLVNKKNRFYAFPLDFWYTNKVADYFSSLLHADWSFKEVMKSWCVLLLGLYLARGACVSLIEGSLWHGCSGLPHLGASSGSRWVEIRQG